MPTPDIRAWYASLRKDWPTLIRFHVREYGTRPNGDPSKLGTPWTDVRFAEASNTGRDPRNGSRTVQNWFKGVAPRDLRPIEKALMGNNVAYDAWRLDLRNAHRGARVKKPKTLVSDARWAQQGSVPVISENEKVWVRLSELGFFERDGENWKITSSFLQALWAVSGDEHVVLPMLRDGSLPTLGFPNVTPDVGHCTDRLLECLVAPALFDHPRRGADIEELLRKTKVAVHIALQNEVIRLGIFEVLQSPETIVIRRRLGYSPVGVARSIKSDLAMNFNNRSAELVAPYYFDSLKKLVTSRQRRDRDDPRYVEVLGLYLYASLRDEKIIQGLENAAKESGWGREEK